MGVRALRGALVAAKVFDKETAAYRPVTLAVRDTRGTPEGAARAVSELVEHEGAVVILGPVTSLEAPAAAAAAQNMHVPIITLTQREEIVTQGEYVFRSLLTPRDEARAVAAYATGRLLVSRFAILSPEDPFGRAMAAAFEEEVVRGGGRITKRASYQAVFDIPARVAQLFDRTPQGAPVAPWDAVFVPDGTFAARIALGRLRDAGARNFRLLGTGLWNTPETVRDGTLNGAVFSAAFSESDPRPASRAFAASYRRTFDDAPDAVSAQAHDVASLLMALLRTAPVIGPVHLRERLEVTSGIEGAAGVLRFEGGRVARRGAIILTVRGSRIVPVSPGTPGESTRATR